MIIGYSTVARDLYQPQRKIKARVVLNGATPIDYDNNLLDIKIDRVGENGKFFGFGVSQKVTITIRDKDRELDPSSINTVDIYFTTQELDDIVPILKDFQVVEKNRDENNNNLTLICYDKLYKANEIQIKDLGGVTSNGNYTVAALLMDIRSALGFLTIYNDFNINTLTEIYPKGNYDGTETLREVLDDIAEITQTIYFHNHEDKLEFKKLNTNNRHVIPKNNYFTLKSGEVKTLSTITHITDLGDNLTKTADIEGVEQVLRENGFLNNNPDAATRLDEAVENICGLEITEFTLSWRGNFLLEVGEYIAIPTKDDNLIPTYLINDSITYNGGMKQETSWKYSTQEATTANPTNLGEAIKETFARVDKAKKEITLLASETEANREAVTTLQLNTDSINLSVSNLEKQTINSLGEVNNNLSTLSSKVDMAITSEDVNIAINKAISNGTTKVETTTGYKFDETGLTVSKSGTEMTTTITENGMTVKRNDEAMLTANNQGVVAENLQANNFLIIDGKARLEYISSNNRVGCFWIGG